MLKRARCDINGKREKHYLFYGSDAAIRHLAQLESESTRLIQSLRRTKLLRPAQEEEDRELIASYEGRGMREKWALLTTVTVCLVGLLFQEESRVAVSLPLISRRLAQAKRVAGTSSDDVNRRVYDIVSILASCNFVVTSSASKSVDVPSRARSDASCRRKHVRFNFALFPGSESAGSQPIADASSCLSDRSTQQRLLADAQPVAINAVPMEASTRNRQAMTTDCWWSDSFKSLSFVDALMTEERVGLEVRERFEQDWVESWGFSVLSHQIHQDFLHSDMGLPPATTLADIDFKCHEDLTEELADATARF